MPCNKAAAIALMLGDGAAQGRDRKCQDHVAHGINALALRLVVCEVANLMQCSRRPNVVYCDPEWANIAVDGVAVYCAFADAARLNQSHLGSWRLGAFRVRPPKLFAGIFVRAKRR